MPRTVGMRPTAVYGLIIRSLLDREWSATGDARDLADAVVVQLDRHLVLLRTVGPAIEQGPPPRRRHALVLLVGSPEPGDDLVVGGAGRDQGDERLSPRPGPVRPGGGRREAAPGAPPPSDPAAHVLAQDEHPREVRHEQDHSGDDDRPPVDAAREVVELHPQALGADVLGRQQRERPDPPAGPPTAL